MRTRIHWVALAAGLLVLASAGCTDSRDRTVPVAREGGVLESEDAAIDADTSVLDRAPKLGEMVCARHVQCAGDYGFPYDDLAACERIEQESASASSRLGTREACEEALAALDCEALIMRDWPEACVPLIVTPWTRPVDDGELCSTGLLCHEGSRCMSEAEDCGRCEKPRSVDEACEHDFECQSWQCREDGTCASPVREGGACVTDRNCADGLECADSVCSAKPREGESCAARGLCAAGSYCKLGTCAPFAIPKLGDACAGAFGCTAERDGVRYGSWLTCREGVCGEAPGSGEACTDFCREGYSCLEGVCEAITSGGGVGDACMHDTCSEELICTFDGCVRPARLGEPWLGPQVVNAGCAPGLYGGFEDDAHLCLERVPDGEPCTKHSQCLGGLCNADGVCAQSACNQQD